MTHKNDEGFRWEHEMSGFDYVIEYEDKELTVWRERRIVFSYNKQEFSEFMSIMRTAELELEGVK